MTSAEEMAFLQALKANGNDRATLLAYADWLEEHSRPYRAMMQRVQAGVSQVRFKVRRKSDGLFSEGGERNVKWSAGGKEWERLSSVRAHLAASSNSRFYGRTSWDEIELVVFEVRVQIIGTLPFSFEEGEGRMRKKVIITEPM